MPPFWMTVTTDEQSRSLAVEVAAKYVAMSGGTPADVSATSTALADTLGQVAKDATEGATVDMAFQPNGQGIEVTVTSGTYASVVRCPVLAKKG